MPPAQHYPEPTVGALIFDPAGRLFLMQSHKWSGRYVDEALRLPMDAYTERAIRAYLAQQAAR